MTAPAKSNYRSDIDGLRGVAVAIVVLFHANVPGFGGGFVGVDIFFVISGFLITQILLKDISLGKFSLWSFYERRVRRILPALFAVSLFALATSLFVLVPPDMKNMSASVAGTAAFASNFIFWLQSGYFAAAAQSRPLLHTWSLAVEEQFYIFYPLALWVIARYARSHAVLLFAILTVLALLLSEILARYAPGAAFFLAPGRAWELLLGCTLARSALSAPQNLILRESLGAAGLLAIAASTFELTSQTRFPGIASILPCGGAALLLWANTGASSFAGRILSSRPIVATGLISYSLYLWHWPLLVFGRIWLLHPLTPTESLAIVGVSTILAVVSWRCVEQPFRTGNGVLGRRGLFATSAALTVAMFTIGVFGYLEHGWPQRFSKHVNAMLAYVEYNGTNEFVTANKYGTCFAVSDEYPYDLKCFHTVANQRNVLLWGDSHAAHYAGALTERLARENIHVIQASRSGCRTVLGVEFGPSLAYCTAFNKQIVDLIGQTKIDAAIISARWLVVKPLGMTLDQEFDGLVRTVDFLRRRHIPVVIIGPSIDYAEVLPVILARNMDAHGTFPGTLSTHFAEGLFACDRMMKVRFARLPGVTYVSVLDRVCPYGRCPTMTAGNVPLEWDYAHLTAAGARFVVGKIIDRAVMARISAISN